MKSSVAFSYFLSLAYTAISAAQDYESFSAANTIERDIAVIGGGSSGTYAAIRLKDLGQKVIVIEKEKELGGHVNTYTAPGGVPVNYGVSNFQNYTVVRNFFARLNVPIAANKGSTTTSRYVDFKTGTVLPNGTMPTANFTGYFEQLAKYPYLEYGWDLPEPVPEDLLLPFGQFIEKYNLQSVAYTLSLFTPAQGNVLNATTIHVLKQVDRHYLEGVFGANVGPASRNAHEIFDNALTDLGADALLNSTVQNASRSGNSVRLIVKTPSGNKLIKAKKLLISAPPKVDILAPFGLDSREKGIFSQFENQALYVGLLTNTRLDPAVQYFNVDPSNSLLIPQDPASPMVWATAAEGVYWAWYKSPARIPEAEVRAQMVAAVQRIAPGSQPRFVAYSDHSPAGVTASADKIRDRFYDELKGLQGYRNTWYTGSAWVSDHSARLWNFTEYEVIPRMLT